MPSIVALISFEVCYFDVDIASMCGLSYVLCFSYRENAQRQIDI